MSASGPPPAPLLLCLTTLALGACPPRPVPKTPASKPTTGVQSTGSAKPVPRGRRRLVFQHTPANDIGALFVSSADRHLLLRWSADELFLHDAREGHLLRRASIAPRTVLAASVSPDGSRACALVATKTGSKPRGALVALELAADKRERWTQQDLPIGRHSALLATNAYCAALLPGKKETADKPYIYRAFGWPKGRPLFDSHPVRWQHQRPLALQLANDGKAALLLLSNKQAQAAKGRYRVEVLSVDSLATTISLDADCAQLAGSTLHLAGSRLARAPLVDLAKQAGLRIVDPSSECAHPLPFAQSRAASRGLTNRLVESRGGLKTRAVDLWTGESGLPKVYRRLAATRGSVIAPDAADRHIDNGALLLRSRQTIFLWPLQQQRPRRLATIPLKLREMPATPPRFTGGGAFAVTIASGTDERTALIFDPRGWVRWTGPLSKGEKLRPRPDGKRWVLRRGWSAANPSDVRWYGAKGKWKLIGHNELGGAFTLDPASGRATSSCCRRDVGQGGVFGPSVSPKQSSVAVVITGRKKGLHLLRLPGLGPARAPLPLSHERNDFASTVWLSEHELALIRDATFVNGPPTATIYDRRSGNVVKEIAFADRGKVFWAPAQRLFYQHLQGSSAIALYDRNGAWLATAGIADRSPFIARQDGSYTCSGRGCEALRCTTPDLRSLPASACRPRDTQGILPRR